MKRITSIERAGKEIEALMNGVVDSRDEVSSAVESTLTPNRNSGGR